MKHSLALITLGIVTGLLFCFYALPKHKIIFIAVAARLGIAALLLSFTKSKAHAEALMASVVFISSAFAGMYNVYYTNTHVEALKKLSGEQIELTGTVTDLRGEGYCRITISGKINDVRCRVSFYSSEPIEYGSRVTLNAVIHVITDSEDILYSYPDRRFVNLDNVYIRKIEAAKGVTAAIASLRIYSRRVSKRIAAACGKKYGGILCAMLCGDTTLISKDTRTAMTRAGIGHILAVSGLHISVIAGFTALVLRRFGKSVSFIASEAVMLLFIIFSGAKISSIRALIMMSVLLFSDLILQEYSGKESIALCIVVMSIANPYIIASPSFILSVTGVFGAGTAASAVIDSFRIKSRILQGLMVSACAAVCTLPATISFFGEISLVSVATNFLLVPLCSAALCLSMIFALFGCPAFLEFLVILASKLTSIALSASEIISSLRFSWISVKAGFTAGWITIIVIVLGTAVSLIYLFTGSIKKTSKAAAFAYLLAVLIMLCAANLDRRQVYLNVETQNGEFVCTVSKGESSVLVFSDESFADRYLDGLDGNTADVEFAIILSDYESQAAVIRKLRSDGAINPIILSGDNEVTVSVFGIIITASPDSAQFVSADGQLFIAKRKKSEYADISISVFDGVSIINANDEIRIVEDELEIEYRLEKIVGNRAFGMEQVKTMTVPELFNQNE